MEDEELIKCRTCGRMLPISMFTKKKSYSRGINTQCKDCVSKYNKVRYYSTNINLAFDRIPWPFNADVHKMDEQAIEDYRHEKQLKR